MEEPFRQVQVDDELGTRLAGVRRREHVRGLRKREWVFLGLFLALALGCWVNFQRVVVVGHSMDPSYHSGQTVLVWKLAPRSRLHPGDVIVFRQGSDELIKRIVFVAPPQEAAHFPPAGFPSIITTPQGDQLPGGIFDWYFMKVNLGLVPKPPVTNTIYVMGDNFPISDDSRHFGPISPDQILGRVIR